MQSTTNRVRTLFTSVGKEADRIGATQPIVFTYVDSRALRALYEAPCGSGGWSSRYFADTVGFSAHRGKGCLGEGWSTTCLHDGVVNTIFYRFIPPTAYSI